MSNNDRPQFKAGELFQKMNALMNLHGSEIVKRVQSVYLFEIKPSKNE